MKWSGVRRKYGILFLYLSGALLLVAVLANSGLLAQGGESESDVSPDVIRAEVGERPSLPAPEKSGDLVYLLPDRPPVEEPAPERNVFAVVDGAFNTVVQYLAGAFFYPVGQYERQYIVVDDTEIYGRDGSDGPYFRLEAVGRVTENSTGIAENVREGESFRAIYLDSETTEPVDAEAIVRSEDGAPTYYVRPEGSDGPFSRLDFVVRFDRTQSKTADDLKLMSLRRELNVDADRNYLLNASIVDVSGEKRDVEIAIAHATPREYVLDEEQGRFRKKLGYRQLLGDDKTEAEARKTDPSAVHVMTVTQAEALAREGRLQYGVPTGDAPLHLRSEMTGGFALIVLWLFVGATIFTVYMRFYNIWGFWHAIQVVCGKYDNPDEPGEVSHAQALSSALSATVGLGTVTGVSMAMALGGPGAFFWMTMCGFLGMTSKFVECTLAHYYREVGPDGTVMGGPMQYLYLGFKEKGMASIGLVLSVVFAVMCIMASFGGGNMFQANQAGASMLAAIQRPQKLEVKAIDEEMAKIAELAPGAAPTAERLRQIDQLESRRSEIERSMADFTGWFKPIFGVVIAVLVGIVIIGGIKRIAATAEKIVPTMCALYCLACIWIIGMNLPAIPSMLWMVITEAFSPTAFGGGLIGVLVIGVQRAAFSNEAGVGSAAIAHSAARTDEPIREGAVSLLEPFIDTIICCSMTAMVILLTGEWTDTKSDPAELTANAFGKQIWFFPYILTIAILLFAYATQIAWSYYGERCWTYLFGARTSIIYRILYVIAAFCGVVFSLKTILDFSDMMLLALAFPNFLGLYLLAPKVRRELLDYWSRMKAESAKEVAEKPA